MTHLPQISMCWTAALVLSLASIPVRSDPAVLTVVRDVGGVSALPYYEALHLQSHIAESPSKAALVASTGVPPQSAPAKRYRESDLLPVRSTHLTPGPVTRRTIHAPGLTPFFLVGSDAASQAWLLEHAQRLQALHAVGFVIHVESMDALNSLRRLAPGLTLSPASGDDLARRLHLDHYPTLITTTGIEP